MNKKLNVTELEPNLVDVAKHHIDSGDGPGFVLCAKPGAMLALVFDNTFLLKQRGMYEDALVAAYSWCKTSNWYWHMSEMNRMFRRGDRDKLLNAGDPFDAQVPLRVYRGVAGKGAARHVRGLSWTVNVDQACWFAMRWYDDFDDPAVYSAVVRPEHIYLYANDNGEEEVICMPRSCKRLDLPIEQMLQARARVNQRIEAHNQAMPAGPGIDEMDPKHRPSRFLMNPPAMSSPHEGEDMHPQAPGKHLVFWRSYCGREAQRNSPLVRQPIAGCWVGRSN